MAASGELKTKPTQHSVKELQSAGLQPDVLVLRTEHPLSDEVRRKVALFCNVTPDAVVESIDVPTIYEVPLRMHAQHLDEVLLSKLGVESHEEPDMTAWREFVDKIKHPKYKVEIALVGKYTELPDAYKSICESFIHAGAANNCKVKLTYVNSEKITRENVADMLGRMAGIVVAPGFGNRGIEGKIEAVRYARENKIPFFGICLGMQSAVIEFARNVLGLPDAHSSEMEQGTKNPVIDLMEEQKGITAKGGTMRLGGYPCALKHGTRVYEAYGKDLIVERHRHRYEINPDYTAAFEKAFALMGEGNTLLNEIVATTMEMCVQSSLYAMLIGVPIGALVGVARFPGRRIVVLIMRTLMGLPAVAVGILVYLLFSGTGPFGKLGLMYSVELMVIAQVILITPVVAGFTETAVAPAYDAMRDTAAGMGLNKAKIALLAVNETKYQLVATYLFAFSRSIAEVGAVQIVGGNILHKTRVMTTAIALNYNMGQFSLALALGIILMLIVLGLNVIASALQAGFRKKNG